MNMHCDKLGVANCRRRCLTSRSINKSPVNLLFKVFLDFLSFGVVKQNTFEDTLKSPVLTGHLRGLYFYPPEEKHEFSFFPFLVELISCFLAVTKEKFCNPVDKYQAEYSNQLKAICMSVLKPAARDFLSCHLS